MGLFSIVKPQKAKTFKTEQYSSQIDCHSRIHSTVKEVKAETTKRETLGSVSSTKIM